MIIQHNIMALGAQRQFGIIDKKKEKTIEKLSSGYKINRTADDAAGLSISEKMRRQIRGLTQATKNMQDGVSFVQVADGALNEVQDIMQRMNELSVKAANGTHTAEDREMLDEEVQKLKEELQRIFKDTEFNEIKIFKEPYSPEITGTPDDIRIFMTDDNTYGGISINNIRYTWDELADRGLEIQSDGTYAGGECTFETWDGEEVTLEATKGQPLNMLSRKYGWKADGAGIYINNVLATTWTGMGLDPSAVKAGEYSFGYHGMNISFKIEEDNDDVIAQINGDYLNCATWDAVPSYVTMQQAADIKEQAQTFELTNSNLTNYLSPNMKLVAGTAGMGLTTDTALGYTQKAWTAFRDNNYANGTAEEAYGSSSNHGYPIGDWGLGNDDNKESDITFDDKAVYRYKDDELTGFVVDFSLSDETSKETALKALSVDVKRNVSAPVTSFASVTNADHTMNFSVSLPQYSIRFQEMMGRNFGDGSDTCQSQMEVELAGDQYRFRFSVGFDASHMQEYEGVIGKDALQNAALNGSPLSVTLTNAAPEIHDDLDDALVGVKDSDRRVTVTLDTTGYSGDLGDDGEKQQYIEKALDFINGAKPVIKALDTAKVTMSVIEKNTVSYKTNYGVKVNPSRKKLGIQAGAEAGQHIELEWSPLSLGILGLSSTNVLTTGSAGGAIEEIKKALQIVSEERSAFGAYQNRMEQAIRNVENVRDTTETSESLIRDTEMDQAIVNLSIHNILTRAGSTMLSQANQSAQGVLRLIQ